MELVVEAGCWAGHWSRPLEQVGWSGRLERGIGAECWSWTECGVRAGRRNWTLELYVGTRRESWTLERDVGEYRGRVPWKSA